LQGPNRRLAFSAAVNEEFRPTQSHQALAAAAEVKMGAGGEEVFAQSYPEGFEF